MKILCLLWLLILVILQSNLAISSNTEIFLNIRPFLINLNVPASSSHIRNIVINDADGVTYEQQWIEEYKTNQEDTFDKDWFQDALKSKSSTISSEVPVTYEKCIQLIHKINSDLEIKSEDPDMMVYPGFRNEFTQCMESEGLNLIDESILYKGDYLLIFKSKLPFMSYSFRATKYDSTLDEIKNDINSCGLSKKAKSEILIDSPSSIHHGGETILPYVNAVKRCLKKHHYEIEKNK